MKKKASDEELRPLVDSTNKLGPWICRIPTIARVSPAGPFESVQVEEHGRTSSETAKESSDNPHGNVKVANLEESLPRFGPLYRIDQPSVEATKEKAWQHVLKKSVEKNPSELKEEVIKEIYSTAMRNVEQESKEIYSNLSDKEFDFRWMMIKDGCFFLQLALLVLGCSEHLGYPTNDPIFGKKQKEKDLKIWIEAMFYVGNQIPLTVLKELMNQTFFQDVINNAKWDTPPSSLCKKVLYEVLVLPALKRDPRLSLIQRIMGKGNNVVEQRPLHDLLHGLQYLVIGSHPFDHHEAVDHDQIDLEANQEEVDDYDRILEREINNGQGTFPSDRITNILNAIGLSSATNNRKRIFPCATELKRAGIRIKKLKSGGARDIDFKSCYIRAYLYLPVFMVDDNTEIILRNLKIYEMSQNFGKNRREVSSYLRVMSDIIQTTKDVKLLKEKGVIVQGNSTKDVDRLPAMLSRLSSEDIRLTHEFHILRRKLSEYSSPWIHYKGVFNLVVFLTFFQAFFALLAYVKPPTR